MLVWGADTADGVKVTLTTRCGCSREINIPSPPPQVIRLPLRNTDYAQWLRNTDFDYRTNDLGIREFTLRSADSYKAEYVETREWRKG